MPGAWRENGDGYRFDAGDLRGRIDLGRTPPGRIHASLSRPESAVLRRLFDIGPLLCRDANDAWSCLPATAGDAYVQEPFLVVPITLDSSVGVSLSVRFRAEPSTIEAEFRVQTNEPVREISLSVNFSWRGGCIEAPDSPDATPDPNLPCTLRKTNIVRIVGREKSSLTLFADPGRSGTLLLDDIGDRGGGRLTYNLFGRPLEKGVVLIGRIALCDELALGETADPQVPHASWLARSEYL